MRRATYDGKEPDIGSQSMAVSSSPSDKARLHVGDALAADGEVRLGTTQTHYLHHVMRARPGDTVAVFNGTDGEWRARLVAVGRSECRLTVAEMLRPQAAEEGPWLVFAPVKRTGLEMIAEKATELGVARLWPVFTRRTQGDRINLARLKARAVEAAEQCRRLTVPEVAPPIRLADLGTAWPAGRRLLVMDERGGGTPIAEAARTEAIGDAGPPGILIGPEGGFETGEVDGFDELPFVSRVSLGPRILRSETAAIAALTCWQAIAGDWASDPGPDDPFEQGPPLCLTSR